MRFNLFHFLPLRFCFWISTSAVAPVKPKLLSDFHTGLLHKIGG
jgi:hypothetical protein